MDKSDKMKIGLFFIMFLITIGTISFMVMYILNDEENKYQCRFRLDIYNNSDYPIDTKIYVNTLLVDEIELDEGSLAVLIFSWEDISLDSVFNIEIYHNQEFITNQLINITEMVEIIDELYIKTDLCEMDFVFEVNNSIFL